MSSGSVGHGQWGTGTRAVKQWGTGARAVDQWSSGRLSINIHLYVCCIVHTQHRHYSRQILLTYGIEKCQKMFKLNCHELHSFYRCCLKTEPKQVSSSTVTVVVFYTSDLSLHNFSCITYSTSQLTCAYKPNCTLFTIVTQLEADSYCVLTAHCTPHNFKL